MNEHNEFDMYGLRVRAHKEPYFRDSIALQIGYVDRSGEKSIILQQDEGTEGKQWSFKEADWFKAYESFRRSVAVRFTAF
jgi:hypothetical protein